MGELRRDVRELRRDVVEIKSDMALLENKDFSAQSGILMVLHRLADLGVSSGSPDQPSPAAA